MKKFISMLVLALNILTTISIASAGNMQFNQIPVLAAQSTRTGWIKLEPNSGPGYNDKTVYEYMDGLAFNFAAGKSDSDGDGSYGFQANSTYNFEKLFKVTNIKGSPINIWITVHGAFKDLEWIHIYSDNGWNKKMEVREDQITLDKDDFFYISFSFVNIPSNILIGELHGEIIFHTKYSDESPTAPATNPPDTNPPESTTAPHETSAPELTTMPPETTVPETITPGTETPITTPPPENTAPEASNYGTATPETTPAITIVPTTISPETNPPTNEPTTNDPPTSTEPFNTTSPDITDSSETQKTTNTPTIMPDPTFEATNSETMHPTSLPTNNGPGDSPETGDKGYMPFLMLLISFVSAIFVLKYETGDGRLCEN